jgi:APA family basic amino acid/polyamine antiporter
LVRSLGLGGAVVVGVSAMIGTGVFAVWQPALERAGRLIVVAVVIAGVVAALNAASTARLAARIPRAGGVYEYGRQQIGRWAGVLAGTVFLIGKTASASAAALTIGLYLWPQQARLVAVMALAVLLALNLRGVVRSVRAAALMVAFVVVVLVVFTAVVGVELMGESSNSTAIEVQTSGMSLLAASALLFVAFAGYARITVLGEEVREPARVIPRAIAISFAIVLALYVAIAITILEVSRRGISIGSAALSDIAQVEVGPWLQASIVVAAVLAAGAVLLSLIAGVGRTLFAMADAGDAPRVFAVVGPRTKVPYRAELAAAGAAALLVSLGGLVVSLSISAIMILTYYAIAHVAALRLPRRPGIGGALVAITPVLGLLGCAALVGALLIVG